MSLKCDPDFALGTVANLVSSSFFLGLSGTQCPMVLDPAKVVSIEGCS